MHFVDQLETEYIHTYNLGGMEREKEKGREK
jgi:hypothetical protein